VKGFPMAISKTSFLSFSFNQKLTALVLASFLVSGLSFQTSSRTEIERAADSSGTPAGRHVFLAGSLTDNELLVLTSALADSSRDSILLLDTPHSRAHAQGYLRSYRPRQITPVGAFSAPVQELGIPLTSSLSSGEALFSQAERAVVCPAEPRGLLLQSACLAGSLRAPLVIIDHAPDALANLRERLNNWQVREVFAIGSAIKVCQSLSGLKVSELDQEEAVIRAYWEQLRRQGPIQTLVLANPADCQRDLGRLSVLAPWVALQHQAALLLTNESGDNATAVIRAALTKRELAGADSLILVAGLKAIPMERRPNPVPGKDAEIELEPSTPVGSEPFTLATGRLFHEDLGVFTLLLARQQLLREEPKSRRPCKAMVVSNPGGGLSLLETFSRHTTNELRNGGFQTTARFNDEVTREEVRRLMPSQDIFLWEGHYRTMVDTYEMPKWREPLPPALIFLQSCLALNEAETRPLFDRGAIGVVGSSTRTYSASGGSFTLAFFDALLYENQTLGGSLRQAKNFLLAYSLLKAQLLGDRAKLSGANMRSAWAFTLWGDPTLKLVRPDWPKEALTPIRCRVEANTLIVNLPPSSYQKIQVKQYQADMRPNARMAGLLTSTGDEDDRHLVPFIFAEVLLPRAPAGKTPHLASRVPAKHWVFNWDSRRRAGYLLVAPRHKDDREVRFHVSWTE
jgi:hypothetical protein